MVVTPADGIGLNGSTLLSGPNSATFLRDTDPAGPVTDETYRPRRHRAVARQRRHRAVDRHRERRVQRTCCGIQRGDPLVARPVDRRELPPTKSRDPATTDVETVPSPAWADVWAVVPASPARAGPAPTRRRAAARAVVVVTRWCLIVGLRRSASGQKELVGAGRLADRVLGPDRVGVLGPGPDRRVGVGRARHRLEEDVVADHRVRGDRRATIGGHRPGQVVATGVGGAGQCRRGGHGRRAASGGLLHRPATLTHRIDRETW